MIMKNKTTIIIFAILFIPVFTVKADIRIGAKAGVNLAKAELNTVALKTENFTGFQIGPMVEITGLAGFGIDAAILYSQHGFKIKDASEIVNEEKVSTLDIPVNLKMKFSFVDQAGIYLTAGPYVSFKIDDKTSVNQLKTQWETKGFGVGLNFGAGIELVKHLQVGVNYQLSLNENYSNLSVISDLKNAKTRIWSITAAYFF